MSYVPAPYRATNGITAVPYSVPYTMSSLNTTGYNSEGEALSHADSYTGTIPSGQHYSWREQMQSGRLSPGRFEPTPYWCLYQSNNSSRPMTLVKKEIMGTKFHVETLFPRMGGGTGGFKTGVTCYESDLGGGTSSLEAIANNVIVANLKARGLAEAKNKLRKNDIDVSEALAGFDKTVVMVAERVTQVILAYRQVRRGDYRKAAETLGLVRNNLRFSTASKAWLELQYGWRPLLTDIYNGMNEANYMLRESEDNIKVVRRVNQPLITREPAPTEGGSDSWTAWHGSHSGTVSVEVSFKAKVNNPTLNYLASLQVVNPLYYAWVNMPFSFVVDWIAPVGDWLSSITSPLGLTFVSGYRTVVKHGEWSFTATDRGIQQPLLFQQIGRSGEATGWLGVLIMEREKFYSWPIEMPYFRIPSTSPERIANAIALTAATSNFYR